MRSHTSQKRLNPHRVSAAACHRLSEWWRSARGSPVPVGSPLQLGAPSHWPNRRRRRPSRAPRTQRAPSHGHALRTHHQHHARQLPVAVAVAVAVYIYKIVKTLQVENV